MTSRVLPPHEWPRLACTELEAVYPHLDPDQADVVVVEDEQGRLVACWALLRVFHVEGLWVAPEHRGRGRAGIRLFDAMRRLCGRVGARRVFTGAISDDVKRLIDHVHGVPLKGEHFVIPIEGA